MSQFTISTFRCDVTPPLGHPLCAGWCGRAVAIADPLFARGVVIHGDQKPIVLCAIDWAEISNDSYLSMCQCLAKGAGTDASRVALHCTHAHCAPWPDAQAHGLLRDYPDVPQIMDTSWMNAVTERLTNAVQQATPQKIPVTHIGFGQSAVHQVASNRRILDSHNHVQAIRWTKTSDPTVRAMPEGLIDPILRSVSFWNEAKELATMHYYAVHPTSYDDDRTITADFVGIALQKLQEDKPNTLQIYFTGCAGNITAGKYNDGSPANRQVLADRIYQALKQSSQSTDRHPLNELKWSTQSVHLPPREDLDEQLLRQTIADAEQDPMVRNKSAIQWAYLQRQERPILLSCLTLGDHVKLLHVPGEAFVEYQLEAQRLARKHFVATAAYGDCGPGYICLERSSIEGGYEPTDSFVAGRSEHVMREAIHQLILGP